MWRNKNKEEEKRKPSIPNSFFFTIMDTSSNIDRRLIPLQNQSPSVSNQERTQPPDQTVWSHQSRSWRTLTIESDYKSDTLLQATKNRDT